MIVLIKKLNFSIHYSIKAMYNYRDTISSLLMSSVYPAKIIYGCITLNSGALCASRAYNSRLNVTYIE